MGPNTVSRLSTTAIARPTAGRAAAAVGAGAVVGVMRPSRVGLLWGGRDDRDSHGTPPWAGVGGRVCGGYKLDLPPPSGGRTVDPRGQPRRHPRLPRQPAG